MTAPRFTALGVAVATGIVAASGVGEWQGGQDRVAGWRGDIEHVVSEARRVHAGPARPAHSPAFADAAADLARRIPELPDRRIAVELQRLMAMLGDGHSLVYPRPSPRMPFGTLPIDVYVFEDGVYVVDGSGPAAELVGSRVVRIGSRPTEDVLREMAPYVSRDNDMALKAFAGVYLVVPAFLETWGAADRPERATLTLSDSSGANRTITLEAGPARRIRRRLAPPRVASQPPPLYLQRTTTAYFTQPLPDHGALYFQFNQVMNAPETLLAAFASHLGVELASTRAEHLIVDVRHNSGGNNMLLAPLIDTIAGFASGSRERGLYVLTGRSTFSAAQNFINRLERRVPSAIFAGEPSMSSPNFTGEDNPVPLPFSGLTVSISNRYWQDSDAADRRPWIAPHLPVALSSRDWLENRDPVLDAVLQAIGERRELSRPGGPAPLTIAGVKRSSSRQRSPELLTSCPPSAALSPAGATQPQTSRPPM